MAKGSSKSMLSGLTDKSVAPVDSSMKPKGGSVNAEATRSATASNPRTLGPRNA